MTGLVADIGGTNARFSLVASGGGLENETILATVDFPDFESALQGYLNSLDEVPAIGRAAFSIAGPVAGDRAAMTNLGWTISAAQIRRRFGWQEVHLVNDFAAIALSVPELGDADRVQLGGGDADGEAPIAVIGPGTGLGVSALIPSPTGPIALATEGGHVTLAGTDECEDAVIGVLRRRFDHVSAERVLSGPGLQNIHAALAELKGEKSADLSPEEIAGAALSGNDPACGQALAMFFSLLGSVAGNLALTLRAGGGLYIAGGIVPDLVEALKNSRFRARFEGKGRFKSYLQPIPTFVIIRPNPALLGLSAMVGG